MSAAAAPKLCLVSHILPPSPSGQAVVLYRLLSGMTGEELCLASIADHGSAVQGDAASARLPVRYHRLSSLIRLPLLPLPLISHLVISLNFIIQMVVRSLQVARIAAKERAELIMACSGDLYDLPASFLASRLCRIPFVPYLFDDYAFQWTGFSRRVARMVEPVIMRGAAGVIVPNEYLRQEYQRRYGVGSAVIHNPCPLPHLEKLDREPPVFADGEANIVYTGSIYHAHYDAFRNLVEALRLLGRPGLKLHLFTAQSARELETHGIAGPMVVHHPHVPAELVPRIQRQADILFLPLAFESSIPEVIRTSAPGKLGEYLAAGRPVLAHAPAGTFVGWYLLEHCCGIVVERKDPSALAQAVTDLLDDGAIRSELGRRARAQAETDFDVALVRGRFIDYVKECAQWH